MTTLSSFKPKPVLERVLKLKLGRVAVEKFCTAAVCGSHLWGLGGLGWTRSYDVGERRQQDGVGCALQLAHLPGGRGTDGVANLDASLLSSIKVTWLFQGLVVSNSFSHEVTVVALLAARDNIK